VHFEFSELDRVVTDRTAPRVYTDEAGIPFLPTMFKWLLTPWWAHAERRTAFRRVGYLGRRRGAISGGLVKVSENACSARWTANWSMSSRS
jgi:hypothetical protein